jgi:drug/metabolite transporter (DMT)-like permease
VSGRLRRGFAAFAFLTLVWGSTWLVIKDQIAAVPPSWTVTWRFALAAAGMFVLAAWRREPLRLPAAALPLAALAGTLQFAVNFQLIYRAEHFLTSGLVAVLFALLFVPNTALAALFLGRGVNRRFVAGSALAIVGIALLLLHEARIAPPGARVPLGIVLTLLALSCASSANVLLSSARAKAQPTMTLLGWAMAIATFANASFALATEGAPVFDPRPAYVGGIAYLAIVGSVLAFPLYFGLLRDWGPARGGYVNVLVPVVAMTLSTLFEGYRWTPLAVAGAVLAFAGTLVALSRQQGAKPGAEVGVARMPAE